MVCLKVVSCKREFSARVFKTIALVRPSSHSICKIILPGHVQAGVSAVYHQSGTITILHKTLLDMSGSFSCLVVCMLALSVKFASHADLNVHVTSSCLLKATN